VTPIVGSREHIVVFAHIPRARWWDAFTRPGFRHVWVLTRQPDLGGTIVLRSAFNAFSPVWTPREIEHVARDLLAENAPARALAYTAVYRETFAPRPFFSCIELAKLALGLDAPFVFTPKGLFRLLRKRGARRFVPARAPASTQP
jgi:hypothetical protein